jgi:hypothetical protein
MMATIIPPRIQLKKKLMKKKAQKLLFFAAAARATRKLGTIQTIKKKARVPSHSKPVISKIPPRFNCKYFNATAWF